MYLALDGDTFENGYRTFLSELAIPNSIDQTLNNILAERGDRLRWKSKEIEKDLKRRSRTRRI